jgi:uncharacterized RDD family membrane protein YckC
MAAAEADLVAAPVAPAYAGLVTRALAFLVDILIIWLIEILVTVSIGVLVAAVVPGKQSVGTPEILVTAAGCLVFTAVYLVGFWVLVGHTPGMRLMGIAVTCDGGQSLSFGRGVRRLVGLGITILTLGLGFLYLLFDERRRALQDLIGGTVVVRVG